MLAYSSLFCFRSRAKYRRTFVLAFNLVQTAHRKLQKYSPGI